MKKVIGVLCILFILFCLTLWGIEKRDEEKRLKLEQEARSIEVVLDQIEVIHEAIVSAKGEAIDETVKDISYQALISVELGYSNTMNELGKEDEGRFYSVQEAISSYRHILTKDNITNDDVELLQTYLEQIQNVRERVGKRMRGINQNYWWRQ